MEPAKIKSIKYRAYPKALMDIRKLLSPASYYQKFIKGFSRIAKSMTKLTQNGVKFYWRDKQEAAFQLLKQKLCSAPILALPKGNKDFIVYCDASHKGISAVINLDLPNKTESQTEARKPERHQDQDVGDWFYQLWQFKDCDHARVLEKVGSVAYKLELPQELSRVHNTFHVSNLKKCHADEPLAVPLDGLHINDKLHFVMEPIVIIDRDFK
ncbi:putative reverse transcriptase domain-containing protein [Tanacetum coccineum]